MPFKSLIERYNPYLTTYTKPTKQISTQLPHRHLTCRFNGHDSQVEQRTKEL